jgi:hypothetical protein
MGIQHPDDMSGIVLDSYWRKLHGEPIALQEQVDSYKQYWEKVKTSSNEKTEASDK